MKTHVLAPHWKVVSQENDCRFNEGLDKNFIDSK